MGWRPPMRPMRSGYISHFFFAFRAICNPERQNETKSRFSSCRCAAACGSRRSQRLGRHEGASAGSRGHVTSRCRCPCGSGCRDRLVAPTEMRRDREPSQVRQVIGRIATRLSAAHFVHQIAPHARRQAIFRLPQAAGPSFPLLSFWPKARRNKAPETKERRGSRTLLSVCAKTALACPPAAPDQQQMQGIAAGAGGAAVKERQQEEGEAAGRRRGSSRGRGSRGSRGSSSRGRGSRGSSSRGSRGRGSSSDRNAPAASSHRTQGQLQQSSSQTS